MPSFFPSFYPEETFYSACARYTEYMGYSDQSYAIRELLGSQANISKYLACNLVDFSRKFSLAPHDPDYIVQNHTLYPLVRIFLKPRLFEKCPNSINAAEKRSIERHLSPRGFTHHELRFCYKCLEMDRQKYGEGYWHRIHQVHWLHICPQHKSNLKTVYINHSIFMRHLVTIEYITDKYQDYIKNSHSYPWSSDILDDTLFVFYNQLNMNGNILVDFIKSQLRKGEYSINYNQIDIEKIYKELTMFYSREYINSISLSSSESGDLHWIEKLLSGKVSLIDPIKCILLIRFLGYSLRSVHELYAPLKNSDPLPVYELQ